MINSNLKTNIESEYDLIILMIESAEVGVKYWRPGDLKTAKEIIGTEAWSYIRASKMEKLAGQLFEAIANELGLGVHKGLDVHKNKLYVNNGNELP